MDESTKIFMDPSRIKKDYEISEIKSQDNNIKVHEIEVYNNSDDCNYISSQRKLNYYVIKSQSKL